MSLRLKTAILFVLVFLWFGLGTHAAEAANRYWVGGTESWNGTAGSKWALTSGGAGGQAEPTTSDAVFFDGASGVVTVTVDTTTASAGSITFTGFTGTFAGSTAITDTGNLTLPASGMTWSYTGTITFSGTTASTVTCSTTLGGTVVITKGSINGTSFTLSSGCTISLGASPTMTLSASANSGAFINNGTMVIDSGTWTITKCTNCTSTNNGTITNNGTGWVMSGDGTTAMNFTNSATGTITYLGTTISITGDFTQNGTFNMAGITITFSGNNASTLTCSSTTLPVSSTLGGTVVVTKGSINGTSFTLSSGCTISLGASPTMTLSASANSGAFINNGTMVIDSGTWTINTTVGTSTNNGTITHNGNGWAISSSFTNAGTITYAGTLTLNAKTFSLGNQDLSIGAFSSSNATTRVITLGSGTLTLTGTGTVWDTSTTTGLTVTATTGTINLSDTSATAKTFAGGGKSYNNLTLAGGSGGGSYVITGANTFATLSDTGTAAHSITFPNSTTTVTDFSISGTIGNLVTLQRTGSSGTWTISKSSGAVVRDYLSISNSAATGGATWDPGANAVNGGGNSGWTFHPSGLSRQHPQDATPTPTPSVSASPSPSPTLTPVFSPLNSSPTPSIPQGSVEGSLITSPNDPDVYSLNASGYKRLFINPAIFAMYGHLRYENIVSVPASVRDSYTTSMLYRDCETNAQAVYVLESTAEDTGTLHWLNISAEEALSSDPAFFSKVFCINTTELNFYGRGAPYTSLGEIHPYFR